MRPSAAPLVLAPIQRRSLVDATRAALQQAIVAGQFAPGSQLMPEVDLMAQMGVSRTTLREALKRLEEQGLIARRRGRGTFVRGRTGVKDLSLNFGVSEMIAQAGFRPGVCSAAVRREPANPEVAAVLALPEGEPLMVVERVHTADERPVVWSRDMLAARRLTPWGLAAGALLNRTLYEWLKATIGIRVIHGAAQVTPVEATSELAAQLDVGRGTPLLRLTQTDYDAGEVPVLYSIEYHLPDVFVFLVNRKGPHW